MPTPEELASAKPDKTTAPNAVDLIEAPDTWIPEPAEKNTLTLAALLRAIAQWRDEPEHQP